MSILSSTGVAGERPEEDEIAGSTSLLQTGSWPSLMPTGTWPSLGAGLFGAGYGGIPVPQPGFASPVSLFGPSAAWPVQEQSLLQSSMAPQFEGPLSGGLQSLLQSSNAQSAQQSQGSAQHAKVNFALAQRHDSFDTFMAHVEERQRKEDAGKALNVLRSAFVGRSGNDGKLFVDDAAAKKSADEVSKGVGEWKGISEQTMQAAPTMALAVKAASKTLRTEHARLRDEVHRDGTGASKKLDEGIQQDEKMLER